MALTIAGVFLVVGLWPWLWGGELRIWSLVVAGVSGLLGLLRPDVLLPMDRIWHQLGLMISPVMTPVILSFLFVALAIPAGLIMKLAGYDPMRRRFRKDADSYWIKRTSQPGSLRNQF